MDTDYSSQTPKVLIKDKNSGEYIPIDKSEILSHIIDNDPLYQPDPSNPQLIKRINLVDFKPDGPLSTIFHSQTDNNNSPAGPARSCPKPAAPPNGSWRCEGEGAECSLLCQEGYMTKKPVIIT